MTTSKEKIKEFPVPYDPPTPPPSLTPQDALNLPIDFFQIFRLIETVTAVPTGKPTKLYDQVKLYTDSLSAPTIYRVYFYISGINAWHYAALT